MTTDTARELAQRGRHYVKARAATRAHRAELDALVRAAVADGMSEVEAARLAGLDRMTVRKVLGKR